MSIVLNAQNVSKMRGRIQTLKDVTLSVPEASRVALLGHNGAGKSTLIKLILGLTRLSGGEISVCGHPVASKQARAMVAYLPEAVAFQPALTGREVLTLFARLSGVATHETVALLERVGLSDAADRCVRTYSKGMRQRLGLAQVILGRPKLALLDEPTSGLDPVSRHDLYTIIDECAAEGTAVLIASHALTEVEARTDRIAILRQGELVVDDTLANLTRAADLPIIVRASAQESDAADQIARETGGERINCRSVEIRCRADAKMEALQKLSSLGKAVTDIDITPPGLEDLYRYYSKDGS